MGKLFFNESESSDAGNILLSGAGIGLPGAGIVLSVAGKIVLPGAGIPPLVLEMLGRRKIETRNSNLQIDLPGLPH